MIPKIKFSYSSIYDELYKNSIEVNKHLRKIGKRYPSMNETIGFMERFEKFWRDEEKKILKKISEIMGVVWSEKSIICYVVGNCRPMSNPLTIRVFHDMEFAVDMLTHELIHNLQANVSDLKWNKWLKYLDSKYPRFSSTTKGHILLNAVHKKLYFELFSKERFERDLYESSKVVDYKNSWSVVEKDGYDNIIKKFKQVTR